MSELISLDDIKNLECSKGLSDNELNIIKLIIKNLIGAADKIQYEGGLIDVYNESDIIDVIYGYKNNKIHGCAIAIYYIFEKDPITDEQDMNMINDIYDSICKILGEYFIEFIQTIK